MKQLKHLWKCQFHCLSDKQTPEQEKGQTLKYWHIWNNCNYFVNHKPFIILYESGLFIVEGRHQGNRRLKYIIWKLYTEELKQLKHLQKFLFHCLSNKQTPEQGKGQTHKRWHIWKWLISCLFVSFETGSSQEDLDILDFNAQRLQTDSALENISEWRKFGGEDMFRSKELSHCKL